MLNILSEKLARHDESHQSIYSILSTFIATIYLKGLLIRERLE